MVTIDYCEGRGFKVQALRTQARSDFMLTLQAITLEEVYEAIFVHTVSRELFYFSDWNYFRNRYLLIISK